MSYAELVLGSKIQQGVIITLVQELIRKKGTMPVGEVGKNLQLITGSDSISKRLKDQYGGLKKTIEGAL
jgi:hypothetical protein